MASREFHIQKHRRVELYNARQDAEQQGMTFCFIHLLSHVTYGIYQINDYAEIKKQKNDADWADTIHILVIHGIYNDIWCNEISF